MEESNESIWFTDQLMKNHKYNMRIAIIAGALLLGSWLFWHSSTSLTQQANSSMATNVAKAVAAVPTNATEAIATNSISHFTAENINSNAAAISDAYKQGKIDKGEAMQAMFMEENKQPLDFFGKVIDQYGRPVVGAKVQGNVMLNVNFVRSGEEAHYTETDAEGNFSFLGLHGVHLGVVPAKEGYEMGMRGAGFKGPNGEKTSPNDRATLTMWKLKGAEPLAHANLHSYIPCDGTQTAFDLLTGKKDVDGDLVVKITRDPVNIDRSKPFNWSLNVKIPSGGLQEITGIYPNEAPVEGYESEVALNFPTNTPNWRYSFSRSFFFKSKNGQVYGKMSINVLANFQPPPTLFDAEIYANPSGSRNLEFDPAKQIR